MKLPFYKQVKKIFKSENNIEIFLVYYIIFSIILHLFYITIFKNLSLVYGSYYNDSILYTLPNSILLLFELISKVTSLVFSDNIFDGVIKSMYFIFDKIDFGLSKMKYIGWIYRYITWTYIYLAGAILIILMLIKKFLKFSIRLSIVLAIVYVIYSVSINYLESNDYQKISYESASRYNSANVVKVNVTSVIDGDTIKVNYNGKIVKVRLLYIDTPEDTTKVEPFGANATKMMKSIVDNSKTIELEFDGDRYDKYGRTLAWVWADGVLAEEILTKNGLVKKFYDYGNYKYEDIMHNSMNYAKSKHLNIYE